MSRGALAIAPSSFLVVLAALCVIPLFVQIGGPGLVTLPETAFGRPGVFTLPLSAAACLATALAVFVARRIHPVTSSPAALDFPLVGFCAIAGLVLLAGLVVRPGLYNFLYFAQTLAPISAYYVASRLTQSGQQGRNLVRVAAGAAIVWAALMVGQAIAQRGLGHLLEAPLGERVGPIVIYQVHDYVPFVFTAAFLAGVFALLCHGRSLAANSIGLFFLAAVVLDSYARGPVLVILVGLAVIVAASWKDRRGLALRATAVTAAALVLALLFNFESMTRTARVVQSFVARAPAVRTLIAQTPTPSAEPSPRPSAEISAVPVTPSPSASATSSGPTPTPTPASPSPPATSAAPAETPPEVTSADDFSNSTRIESAQIALLFLIRNPLIGAGFAPIPWQELSPDLNGMAETALLPAHNQYLDMGFRGGVPLLVAYLWLMLATIRHAWRLARRGSDESTGELAGSVLAVVLPTILVANLYQNNFTQPFSAFFLWFLIGTIGRWTIATAVRE